jgi:hypothetical protein
MSNVIDNFFEIGSNPLKTPGELVVGNSYATRHGEIIRIMSVNEIDDSVEYSVVQMSEMVTGEGIVDLDKNLLNLFWTLTRNNASKSTPYENDTN